MLELNISFDILLECFSNFFTNVSMRAVSLLGRSVQGEIPVQNELRITALEQSLVVLSCFLNTIVFYSPLQQCTLLYPHWNICIPSTWCVDASWKNTKYIWY